MAMLGEAIELVLKNSSNLNKCRDLAKKYYDMLLYDTAFFIATKVCALTNNEPADVCFMAKCLFNMKQYRRAVAKVRFTGLDKTDIYCRLVVAQSLIEVKEFQDALTILSNEDIDEKKLLSVSHCSESEMLKILFKTPDDDYEMVKSVILTLKGRALEGIENRSMAIDCYKEAVQNKLDCYSSFSTLLEHRMLSSMEAKEMLEQYAADTDFENLNNIFFKSLYRTLLWSYVGDAVAIPPSVIADIPVVPAFSQENDVKISRAESLYYKNFHSECFQITEQVLRSDPYHKAGLLVHIACLVELGKVNKLYLLAHNLVDTHPEIAVSWFAVGCYYFLIGKQDPARRYLSKATTMEKTLGVAWLAYGHSFAVENEHDQAMAAYFKSNQLLKGCHLPLLYIGLECGLTSNAGLSYKFFEEAREIAPNDPFVLHEMGIIEFQNQNYDKAKNLFLDTLTRINEISDPLPYNKWEMLYNNLGHVYRKLKRYDKAIEFHQHSLLFGPMNASTLTSLGFAYALARRFDDAIAVLHKSLGVRRNDSFTSTLLNYVIEIEAVSDTLFEDYENDESLTTEESQTKQILKTFLNENRWPADDEKHTMEVETYLLKSRTGAETSLQKSSIETEASGSMNNETNMTDSNVEMMDESSSPNT